MTRHVLSLPPTTFCVHPEHRRPDLIGSVCAEDAHPVDVSGVVPVAVDVWDLEVNVGRDAT
ncbi:MAG: hypothetical protein JO342_14695 [Solirubrobacterales bacterium]|nr:hypothetical protein [Solirubrobacterales bacterium]MBV9167385.1 hypothetical protein [Solirubrobacterales bacterium]